MSPSTGHLRQTHMLELSWDLELDTSDTTARLELPVDSRFRGDWSLVVTVLSPQHLSYHVVWKRDSSQASSWSYESASCELGWVVADGKEWCPLASYTWSAEGSLEAGLRCGITPKHFAAACQANSYFDPIAHRRFRARFTFVNLASTPINATPIFAVPNSNATATAAKPFFTAKRPNDCRLYFPRVEAELWASTRILSAASPYLKTLLESDFAEGTRRRGKKRARLSDGAGAVDVGIAESEQDEVLTVIKADSSATREGNSVDDSDDETDDIITQSGTPRLEDDMDDGDFTYREIVITETAYSTYRAVLLYLHTSHISFAPLSSTLHLLHPTSKQSRRQRIEKSLLASPKYPSPVSPKSVYRLAHLLEIPSLLALALDKFKSQLSTANAAEELFSDTSALYDDVRAVAHVVAHWAEVRASQGWRDVNAKIKVGELPHAGAILVELMPLVSK